MKCFGHSGRNGTELTTLIQILQKQTQTWVLALIHESPHIYMPWLRTSTAVVLGTLQSETYECILSRLKHIPLNKQKNWRSKKSFPKKGIHSPESTVKACSN
jgi:hypothetical protein